MHIMAPRQGSKKILVQKDFGPEEIFVKKMFVIKGFWTKEICVQKYFSVRISFQFKKFMVLRIVGSKTF